MTAPDKIWIDRDSTEWAYGDLNAYVEPSVTADEPYHHQRVVDELVGALKAATKQWIDLANSGDAGFWNPEEDDHVIAARALIAKHRKGGA
jgi:hypothetical protein